MSAIERISNSRNGVTRREFLDIVRITAVVSALYTGSEVTKSLFGSADAISEAISVGVDPNLELKFSNFSNFEGFASTNPTAPVLKEKHGEMIELPASITITSKPEANLVYLGLNDQVAEDFFNGLSESAREKVIKFVIKKPQPNLSYIVKTEFTTGENGELIVELSPSHQIDANPRDEIRDQNLSAKVALSVAIQRIIANNGQLPVFEPGLSNAYVLGSTDSPPVFRFGEQKYQ